MEVLFRYFSAFVASLCGLLCPIAPLITTATLFIVVDFITGVVASHAEARREGREWWFESRKAWRTVIKAGFVAIAIVMIWVLDYHVLEFMNLNMAKLFTGFVCGVELWSFLENAATISRAPLFEWMSRWVKRRVEREVKDE
ncbi:MAG: phage holin family protein [Alistipes sp.]|nr:phage holin family protein [Alistipes sp.]